MTTPTMNLDCDGFADALADYLEGDASDGVRSAVEAHASTCVACQQLLADLTAIRTDATALPELTPSRDLWNGIAERIDARVIPLEARTIRDMPRRRLWLRPAVAAAALVVVTAGTTYVLTRAQLRSSTPQVAVAPITKAPGPVVTSGGNAEITSTATQSPDTVVSVKQTLASATTTPAPAARLVSAKPGADAADPVFASEITKLRRIVRERRSQLDPNTVAVLEQSIAVIDSAIAQSRAALAKDPASGFLATQLNHSLEKKVELLRTAALLPSRT